MSNRFDPVTRFKSHPNNFSALTPSLLPAVTSRRKKQIPYSSQSYSISIISVHLPQKESINSYSRLQNRLHLHCRHKVPLRHIYQGPLYLSKHIRVRGGGGILP